MCAWYVHGLLDVANDLMTNSGHIRTVVWNGVLVGLFLISYVINIGYSQAWKKWPALVSGGVFILLAGLGYLTQGNSETELLARFIWGWELYWFAHLGLAFVIASVIGTPGRATPPHRPMGGTPLKTLICCYAGNTE